jgi:nitrite reductase (NO-forming)
MDFRKEGIGSVSNQILTIPVGMRVSWVNRDPAITVDGDEGLIPHRIKIADPMKNVFMVSSALTDEHNSFSYTFNREGTYQYQCMIHPFMKGTMHVVNRGT